MRALVLIPILLAPAAQAMTTPQSDVEELAAKLDQTHRNGVDKEIPSFAAILQLKTLAEDQDAITIGLAVDFGVLPIDGRKHHLIKYHVQEKDGLIERGYGPLGYWTQIDDKVVFLNQAQHKQDKDNVLRDIRLARQLLGYLDPGALLRSLRNASVRTEELDMGRRREPIPCQVVSGFLGSFPLYNLTGEAGPALIEIWVETATWHLVAVEATPVDGQNRPQPEHQEFIALFDYKKRVKDVLLPRELKISTVDAEGKRQLQLGVLLMSIDLDPGFDAEHFKPTAKTPSPHKPG